jgi:carboxypeptidase family protein
MNAGALCRLVAAALLLLAPPLAAEPLARGVARDAAKRPLPEARVELLPVLTHYEQGLLRLAGRQGVPVSAGTTDVHGRFALTADRPGLFTVRIAAPGKVPLVVGPLPLVDEMELPPAELPVDAGATAVLRAGDGRPAVGLWVLAEGGGENPGLGGWRTAPRLARSAEDGALSLPRLAGERLRVRVLLGQGAEEVREGFQGGELRLGAAAPSERRLRVMDARGEPMGGVLVGLGEAAWPAGLTGTDGRLTLRFRAEDPLPMRLLSRDGRQASGLLAVPPHGDGRAAEETLVLGDGFAVAGRIVSEAGGRPLPGALVWCGADPGAFLLTDADGRYATRVMAGGIWLQALAPGHLPARAAPTEPQVRAGRVPTLALTRAGAVAGRVVDAAGAALSGAWVGGVLAPKEGASPPAHRRQPSLGGAMSAADGNFRLAHLKPGELYILQASMPGFLPATARALVPPAGRRAGEPVVLVLAPARAAFGRVQDAGRRPVAGAVVHLLETAGNTGSRGPSSGPEPRTNAALGMVSDSQGRFAVAEIPAQALDLEVAKPGYAPAVLRNFKVPPGSGPIDLGTLTLHPGAAVEGIVSDRQGRPVAKASVFRVETLQVFFDMADLEGRTPDVTTGADGRFSLPDLPHGRPVHLLVSAPGHVPAAVRGIRPPTAAPLKIRLEAGSAFAGRVLNPEGLPVSGADVELAWSATIPGRVDLRTGPPVSKTTKSGRDGRFEVGELPAGSAMLGVSAAGFVAAEEIPVTLPQAPGETKTVVLARGATLEGRVSTTAGDPVPGTRLLAGSAAGISDGEGLFRLDAVPEGPILVEARHPHYERFHRTVRIEEGINHLDVTFAAGKEVRGRVVDSAGAPVAGAAVTLAAEVRLNGQSYGARSEGDGTFVLAPVASGRYRLRADAPGFADTELPETVIVGGETIQGVEVVLAPGGAVTGRILGLASEELPRVAVRARQAAGESKDGVVDAAGNYALRDLAAGDWLVQASLGDGQRQVQARVTLPAGGEEKRDLKFGGHLTLAGLVLYRDQPLADALISLRGEHLAVERSVITDHEGLFRFEELDADTYLLGLSHARELLTHNQPVELASDRVLTIRLERSTVSGTVVDSDSSAPLADAAVDLRHVAGDDGPDFLVGGSSDAAGNFRLERVPPGQYRMTVGHEGYSPAERQLEVPAGNDLPDLEVPLQPAPGAELTVRLASGRIPAAPLHLRLQSPAGAPVLAESRPVGRDGTVRLTTAPPGSWILLAASSDGALATIPLTVPGERATLVLPDATRLAVRVPALATSDALAVLSIATAGGQPLQILGPGGSFTQQWQLVAGKATVEGVPPGNWVLSATAPDGRRWTAAVAADGRSGLQVDLE